MKEGRAIRELALEVRRQRQNKVDYTPATRNISMVVNEDYTSGVMAEAEQIAQAAGGGLALQTRRALNSTKFQLTSRSFDTNLGVNPTAHGQIATHLGIPSRYYTRLQEDFPGLLAENVNELLQAAPHDEIRMVRALDNTARAFLSNAYEPLDNYDLLHELLPLFVGEDVPLKDGRIVRCLQDQNGFPLETVFRSCEVTDTKLYLKLAAPRLTRELKVGATVSVGVIVQNSEVGFGKLAVYPFYEVLQCTNGAFFTEYGDSRSRRHVGSRKGELQTWGDTDSRYIKDSTKAARDQVFFLEMADVVRGVLTEATMNRMMEPMKMAADARLVGHPEAAVRVVAKRFDLADEASDDILRYLIDGGDLTMWGLSNAITRYSQDVAGYDEATRLEQVGGAVITLPASDYKIITEARNVAVKS